MSNSSVVPPQSRPMPRRCTQEIRLRCRPAQFDDAKPLCEKSKPDNILNAFRDKQSSSLGTLKYLVDSFRFHLRQMRSEEAFAGNDWVAQFAYSGRLGLSLAASARKMTLHAVNRMRFDFESYPFLGWSTQLLRGDFQPLSEALNTNCFRAAHVASWRMRLKAPETRRQSWRSRTRAFLPFSVSS